MKQLRPEQKTIVKRGVLLAAIVALLIVAAWANSVLSDDDVTTIGSVSTAKGSERTANASETPAATAASAQLRTGDYFADFRSDRAAVRAQEIELLDGVINDDKDDGAVKEASESKVRISRAMEQEFALEQTLLAKGYDDVAAIVRDDLVTVAVKKADLDQTDAARILEAVRQETDFDAESTKIIPVQ
jgi:hypothetical protein